MNDAELAAEGVMTQAEIEAKMEETFVHLNDT